MVYIHPHTYMSFEFCWYRLIFVIVVDKMSALWGECVS